jgi:hypothetical protein
VKIRDIGMDDHSHIAVKNEEQYPVLDLRLRDLRMLDSHFNSNSDHSIVVRKHVVLLCLDPFRAVVMADRLIIIIPPDIQANQNMDLILKMFVTCSRGWSVDRKKRKIRMDKMKNLELISHTDISLIETYEESGKTCKSSNEFLTTDDNVDKPKKIIEKNEKNDKNEKNNETSIFIPLPISFESHMYEAMLTTVHTLHTQEYLKFNREVHLILIELFPRNAVHIPSILHDKMRTIKNEVYI